jgi:hypothetical protein
MIRLSNGVTLLVIAMLSGMTASARAQQNQPLPPDAAPPGHQDQSERSTAREGSTTPDGTRSGSLSDELSRSQGVVRPPETGDEGVRAPPRAGAQSTPVIPRPGSPGGNQDVQPK